MTATARQPAATASPATGLPHRPPHPAGCSAAGSLQVEFLASLACVGDGASKADAADGMKPALPPAGTPGSSSGGTVAVEGAGGAATAAGPARATPARGRSDAKQKKGAAGGGGNLACQADGCEADLRAHTYYHQRNK